MYPTFTASERRRNNTFLFEILPFTSYLLPFTFNFLPLPFNLLPFTYFSTPSSNIYLYNFSHSLRHPQVFLLLQFDHLALHLRVQHR